MAVSQCSVSDSALITYYPFDGNANDVTIFANHGAVFGSTLAPDRFGNTNSSYYFDGTDDYITANTITYTDSTASISVWVKPIEITLNTYYNITRQGPSPANLLLAFQINGTILSFGVNTSSGYSELDVPIVPSDYTDGQWHCITAAYDGSQQRLYSDGVLIGSQPKTGTILNATSPSPFSIGAMTNSKEFFYGWMDDVKYYDRALTASEASIGCDHTPISKINLGNNTTLCQGETLTLNATTPDANTYLWQDNSTNPTFTITQPGTYWVEVIDICGTIITDTIEIKKCDTILEMPNVFTPNGDRINDLFIPIINEALASMSMTIYNRWGQLIHTSHSLGTGWDGRTNVGELAPDGVYFWIIRYTNLNGVENNLNGHLTLFGD